MTLATAFDTNILAYAAGLRRVDADEIKIDQAGLLIAPLVADGELVLPAQVQAYMKLLNLEIMIKNSSVVKVF